MADLIIKPATGDGNKLILQDKAGGAVLTTADSGATVSGATIINTSGAITTTGAFTSVGIDDNADATTITIDTSENCTFAGDITCENLSTADLIMSNQNPHRAGNEIDGTKGSWVMQEGEENMYLINRKNGKRFKIMLEEV